MRKSISIKTATLIGTIYFLLLGLINLVATFIYAEVRSLDLIITVVCFLPLLVPKTMFLLVFGIVAALISAYLILAAMSFSLDQKVQTSKISVLMGFLLLGSALLASLLLIFSANSSEKFSAKLAD
ncbi:MAG: hypothetical protein ABI151_09365 [Chitinophagaceae bacterium]